MVKPSPLPSAEFLRECLTYEPETGFLRWKLRPVEHFNSRAAQSRWNAKHVGKRAFNRPHSEGYLQGGITFEGKKYQVLAHRIAWKLVTGEDPPDEVDHENLKKDDNRWENLRLASLTQNMCNRPIRSHNRSGYKGVTLLPNGKYKAQISRDKMNYNLGLFDSPQQAHEAYVKASNNLHGEFGRHD